MSLNWKKDLPPLDVRLGLRRHDEPVHWTPRQIDAPCGWLRWEDRTIAAPGGRMVLQRRNGSLNGVELDLHRLNELVLEAATFRG